MQLFTCGHPCEHQLKRPCIGGVGCPLHGFPDHWCCSFVKGKINFKRDKPCEGSKCRWGFTHPTTATFDAVHSVLQEARSLAQRIEAAPPGAEGVAELMGTPFEGTHVVDTAMCAVQMLQCPPASHAGKIGTVFVTAAVKVGDAKALTQLLKQAPKPVGPYLIGAWDAVTRCAMHPPPRTGAKRSGPKLQDVLHDLRHDIAAIAIAALSSGGHLVCRDDQRSVQVLLVRALKAVAPGGPQRFQEALVNAREKFPAAAREVEGRGSATSTDEEEEEEPEAEAEEPHPTEPRSRGSSLTTTPPSGKPSPPKDDRPKSATEKAKTAVDRERRERQVREEREELEHERALKDKFSATLPSLAHPPPPKPAPQVNREATARNKILDAPSLPPAATLAAEPARKDSRPGPLGGAAEALGSEEPLFLPPGAAAHDTLVLGGLFALNPAGAVGREAPLGAASLHAVTAAPAPRGLPSPPGPKVGAAPGTDQPGGPLLHLDFGPPASGFTGLLGF